MKRILLFAMTMLLVCSLKAQGVQETKVNIGPRTLFAYTVSVQKDAKMVSEAMKQRLKDAKLKTKNSEGYLAALEQVFVEISATPISFYTKVEETGKKKDRATVITVCAASDDQTVNQDMMKSNARLFLENFVGYVDKYEATLNMQNEQENLKKAQKALSSAESTVASLEKSIASDQEKIADKKKEIEKLKAKISDCENDIKSLESNIEKNRSKKADADKKVSEASENVSKVEAEVEKYRRMAE